MIPNNEYTSNNEHSEQPEIKSSLPSRSEVHRKKQKKSKKRKAKIKFPLIKLLVLFFILLPIGFYYVYTYLQDRPVYNQKSAESAGESSSINMQSVQSYNNTTYKK